MIEPIQSRCAIVRFQKLSGEQVLKRLMHVVEAEKVPYVPKGLEAIVFTADGDMRQALNNLQSTFMGFDMVNEENVFKVSRSTSSEHCARRVRVCVARKHRRRARAHQVASLAGVLGV